MEPVLKAVLACVMESYKKDEHVTERRGLSVKFMESLRDKIGTPQLLEVFILASDFQAMLDPEVLVQLCGKLGEGDGGLLLGVIKKLGGLGAMNLFSPRGTLTYLQIVQGSQCAIEAIDAYIEYATELLRSMQAGLDYNVIIGLINQDGMNRYHGLAIGRFWLCFLHMCCFPPDNPSRSHRLSRSAWAKAAYLYNVGKPLVLDAEVTKGMDLEEVELRRHTSSVLPWDLRFRLITQNPHEKGGYFKNGTVYLVRGEKRDEVCIICQQKMYDNAYRASCPHTFHSHCYIQWMETQLVCPLCQKQPNVKLD